MNSYTIHIRIHDFFMNSYEYWYEFFDRTLLGTPEFIIFHEIIPKIMNFSLFSWGDHIRNHFWRILWTISWKIHWCHKTLNRILLWIHGLCASHAVFDWASPFCSCCSKATCSTVSLPVQQSYSANTCHIGLIRNQTRNQTSHQPNFRAITGISGQLYHCLFFHHYYSIITYWLT